MVNLYVIYPKSHLSLDDAGSVLRSIFHVFAAAWLQGAPFQEGKSKSTDSVLFTCPKHSSECPENKIAFCKRKGGAVSST
jgi:hypothetical protein